MENYIESSVNAEPVVNVEPQQTVQTSTTNEPVNAGSGEVAAPQVEKPVQSAEDNARFAEIRRRAEREAQDKLISEMYGATHGIHTYADYQAAVKAQQEAEQRKAYQDAGIDPDMVKKLVEDVPEVKWAKEFMSKQQQEQKINQEINDLLAEFPDVDTKSIPQEVLVESVNKGIPLVYSYARYAARNALSIAEQKALKNITQNAQTTPGALSTSTYEAKSNINSMNSKDFDSLVQRVLRGEKIEF